MQILTDPHPMLHSICREDVVLNVDQIARMFKLMRDNNGIGLAAPQVGIPAKFFITAWGDLFFNPRIVQHFHPMIESVEGCLSLPGKQYKVKRYPQIKLATGEVYEGIQAIVIQHEINHLHGTLISDIGVLCE
jgi:peptide deformylase